MGFQTQPKLPVIDLRSEDLNPGSSSWVSARKYVKRALEEYGCFAAVYDKVSAELRDEVLISSRKVLGLPIETKLQNVNDDIYHFGYVGDDPNAPYFESMGIANATTMEEVQAFARLMWPSGNHHFCEIMHSYATQVSELDQMVKRMIFESYGVEKHYESHFESTEYALRYMTYEAPQTEGQAAHSGIPPHTDRGLITILHQNQVSGLEVKTKDGEWFDVDFPPSSFIVMAGDSLLAWSNNRVHAALHRVRVSAENARYSVGLFSNKNGIVQTPEELVDDEHPLRFKPFNNFGLLRFSATEEGKHAESCLKAYCGVSEANSLNN